MKRPSKKEIKAAVDALKDKAENRTEFETNKVGKLSPQHNPERIRKQGV